MTDDTLKKIQEIRNRVRAQPPGPWEIKFSPVIGDRFLDCGMGVNGAKRRLAKLSGPTPLLEFAKNAREDIPFLLVYIEELQERVRTLRRELEHEKSKVERLSSRPNFRRE